MMTINPATLLRHADRTGSIEAVKFADLVFLDRDLFELNDHSIATARVVATIFQGDADFDSDNLFGH